MSFCLVFMCLCCSLLLNVSSINQELSQARILIFQVLLFNRQTMELCLTNSPWTQVPQRDRVTLSAVFRVSHCPSCLLRHTIRILEIWSGLVNWFSPARRDHVKHWISRMDRDWLWQHQRVLLSAQWMFNNRSIAWITIDKQIWGMGNLKSGLVLFSGLVCNVCDRPLASMCMYYSSTSLKYVNYVNYSLFKWVN